MQPEMAVKGEITYMPGERASAPERREVRSIEKANKAKRFMFSIVEQNN